MKHKTPHIHLLKKTVAKTVAEMKRSLASDKEKILEKLEHTDVENVLPLPDGAKTQIAVTVYGIVYKEHTGLGYMKAMIRDKELEGSPWEEAMMNTERLLDDTVKDPAVDPFNSLTGERLARKAYSWIKGLEKVNSRKDWEAPKSGAEAKKWRTKVNYKMIERIGLDSLDANRSSIPALDADIANELQRDA